MAGMNPFRPGAWERRGWFTLVGSRGSLKSSDVCCCQAGGERTTQGAGRVEGG